MRPSTLMLIGLLLCACATEQSAVQAPLESWSLTESLRIGSAEGDEYPLQRVTDLLPTADGGVLILQASAPELPEFGPTGALRHVAGGRGSGPGEFRDITAFGWVHDTLWVADIALRRISFFSADRIHLSDLRVPLQQIGSHSHLYPWTPTLLASEWAIMTPGFVSGVDPASTVVPIYKTDRSGRIADTIAAWPMDQHTISAERRGTRTTVRKLFPLRQLTAISPGGTRVAILTPTTGADAVAGPAGSVRVMVFDADLAPMIDRTLALPTSTASSSVVEDRARTVAERVGETSEERRRLFRDLVASAGASPTYPPADAILVNDSGEVWIRLGYPDDRPRIWWILNEHGEITATLAAPAGVELKAAGPDVVWGLQLDELDVPYVLRYAVQRR